MKTLKFTSLALLIMTLVSFTGTPISTASSNDDSRLSSNDSIYSPPGYMNKDIQQARTLTDKYLANKDKADQKTESTQRDVSQKVEVQAQDKLKPQLKQKQSSSSGANKKQGPGQASLVDSLKYNVTIGSGTDKTYQNGRLISEKINGVTHIYAGFANVGTTTIQDAISKASSGDIILVRGGKTYLENIGLRSGITLYGGYGETGTRNITGSCSVIWGNVSAANVRNVEINGFTIGTKKASSFNVSGSNNVKIYNNMFMSLYGQGVGFTGSTAEIVNNTFATRNDVSIQSSYVTIRSSAFAGMFSIYGNSRVEASNSAFSGAATVAFGSPTASYISSGNNYLTIYGALMNTAGAMATSNNDYFSGNSVGFASVSNRSATQFGARSTDTKIALNTPASSTISSTSQNGMGQGFLADRRLGYGQAISGGTDQYALGGLLKTVILSKEGIVGTQGGMVEPRLLSKQATNNIAANALAVPFAGRQATAQELADSSRLIGILKNPAEDQKMIIDSVSELLADVKKLEDQSGQASLELAKASDDLLQMVASVLLAQEVPGLINQGDLSTIKGIFAELDKAKGKILEDYAKSTSSYYDGIMKDMTKNMALLQMKGMVSDKITREELEKLPPLELEKILEKIRQMKDRSFEENYILQQESKYRKTYLEPGKDKLQKDMKDMLKSFTERLNDVLRTTDKK